MKTRILKVLIVVSAVVITSPAGAGTTLFEDDFSGGLSAWELQNPGYWSIVNGWLDVDIPSISYTFAKAFAGDISWTDYRFEFDVVGVKHSSKICYFRYKSETTGYFLNFRGPVPAEGDPGALRLFKLNDLNKWPHGSWTLLVAVPYINQLGTVYHIAIHLVGPETIVYVNGVEELRYVDLESPVLSGRIGFAGFTGANFYNGNHVRWDNVTVNRLLPVPVEHTTWGRLKSLYR